MEENSHQFRVAPYGLEVEDMQQAIRAVKMDANQVAADPEQVRERSLMTLVRNRTTKVPTVPGKAWTLAKLVTELPCAAVCFLGLRRTPSARCHGGSPQSDPKIDFRPPFPSLCPSEAATDQDSDHGVVPALFRCRCSKCANQSPPLLGREPVVDANAEPASPPLPGESRQPSQGSGDRNLQLHKPTDVLPPIAG